MPAEPVTAVLSALSPPSSSLNPGSIVGSDQMSDVDLNSTTRSSHFSFCPQESQSAPTTPMAGRRDPASTVSPLGLQSGQSQANDSNNKNESSSSSSQGGFVSTKRGFYRTPFNLYEGIFACFRPVLGYFAKTPENMSKSIHSSGDDWDIDFGSIKDLEWLGSGSQGAVFSGNWNGRAVAVKKVKEECETEITHLRHLEHPNIIKFLGVCKQAPVFAIVMEYCTKGQLCEVLKREDRHVDYRVWADWAKQIAEGMDYLHKNEVIHRDLKSPNILVNDQDVLKICDFGTSHQLNKMNSTQMSFCGTVSWVAPEMIKKEPCSAKVDVWSYGVVLWEMLTREQPYKGIDPMAVLWGVGSSQLSLPIPDTAPEGLKLLMKQCWSLKPRNRPSFTNILKHVCILSKELEELGEEEWKIRSEQWRDEARCIEYPNSLKKHGAKMMQQQNQAELLRHKREEELRHAMDIREMYELKLQRVNRMYTQLTNCLAEMDDREEDLVHRERLLDERCQQAGLPRPRIGSFTAIQKQRPLVVRAGPKAISGKHEQDVFCTSIPAAHCYGAGYGYECMSSSGEDEIGGSIVSSTGAGYARGSPYRCSQASSSSGYVPSSASLNFSRQNSSRSSGIHTTTPAKPRSIFSREQSLRHSASSMPQSTGFARSSPARTSTMSDDFHLGPMSLYRNQDGRWSDGRLVQRRKTKARSFVRDSPARIPHARSRDPKRSSCPLDCQSASPARRKSSTRPASHYDGVTDEHICSDACRQQRARSMVVQPSSLSQAYLASSPVAAETVDVQLVELNPTKLPCSSSYDEALRARAICEGCGDRVDDEDSDEERDSQDKEIPVIEYTNPLYHSPVTTFLNPAHSSSSSSLPTPCTPSGPIPGDMQVDTPMEEMVDMPPMKLLSVVDDNADLYSSIDSNVPQCQSKRDTRRASDASAECSSEDEKDDGNGNVLDSSLDSSGGAAAFATMTDMMDEDEEQDEEAVQRRVRHQEILLSSSIASTMANSLERSLELGALHSDGLSDQERNVRAVKNSMRGHRRTHSGPQCQMMAIVNEYSTESDDAVDC